MQAFTKDFCLQNCIYPKLLKFHIFVCNAFALRPLLPCFFISFSVQFSRYIVRSLLRSDLKIQPFSQVFKSNNKRCLVGPSGLEPPTLRLSVVRSSQLSYRPILPIEGVPSKLNNVRQKRTDLRKSVGMVTNMSP